MCESVLLVKCHKKLSERQKARRSVLRFVEGAGTAPVSSGSQCCKVLMTRVCVCVLQNNGFEPLQG